jgi:MFS transporter, PPP family, 3-phenylpropionic acid transporter
MSRAPSAPAVRLAYFVTFLSAGVWLPYMPLYLASLGFDGARIGILGALAPGLRWLTALWLGWLADRRRIRHRVLLLTSALGSLCFVPLLFVTDFPTLLVVFIAINACHGTLIPMIDATVVDHLDQLGGDYGRLRLWGSLSFIIGAAGSAPLVGVYGPSVIPWLLVAPQILLAPVLLFLPRGQRGLAEHARAPWALLTPALVTFLATVFLVQASTGAWNAFFALHVRALGLPDSLPGLTFALAVVVEVALFHWGRRVLEWISPVDLILLTVAVTTVRWVLAAIVTAEVPVVLVQLGHVFTFSAFHLASIALVVQLVPAANATSGQSLYGLMGFGVGTTLGIALAGALVDRLGTSTLFLFEAAVALAAAAPALALRRMRG